MDNILNQAMDLKDELVTHRRWLHSHAEVGFDLAATRQYVREELEKLGISPVNCGKMGLVATIGGKPGKTILLRADMDALPMAEETGLEFAAPGEAMHACGHDFHTTMLLGAAKILKEHEDELEGTVKLMFQPAEEIFEGSKDMIENGLLDDPRPDAALMIHVTAGMPIPAGTIIINAPGVSAPAADYFTIRVQGHGCHGSTPQMGVDALTAAAHILIALQEIHARELAPGTEAVLTIGTIQGGTASNVIADSAQMGGTIRTYDEDTRAFLKQRMTEMASSIAKTYRAEATVEFGSGCPTLTNDEALSKNAKPWLLESLGKEKVLAAADFGTVSRGGGSEDFAYVSREVPSLMLALAAGEPSKGHTFSLHHPKVTLDEDALPYGTAALVTMAVKFLAET